MQNIARLVNKDLLQPESNRSKKLRITCCNLAATKRKSVNYHLPIFCHNRARNLCGIHCNLTATGPETIWSPAAVILQQQSQKTTYHFPKHDSNRSGNLVRIACLISCSNITCSQKPLYPQSVTEAWLAIRSTCMKLCKPFIVQTSLMINCRLIQLANQIF